MTQDFSSLRTTKDIINALSMLYFNLNEIERNYYDIFLNPESMIVYLQRYNDLGVLDTVPVKNLASLQTVALTGSGDPTGVVEAEVGKFYIDIVDKGLYYKSSGNDSYGWILLRSVSNFVKGTNYLAPDSDAPELKELNADNIVSGTLSVERGGTGVGGDNVITGMVKGNGTAPMSNASDGADFLGPISTVGVICYYPVIPIPYGWLMCDGTAYDKSGEYARLGEKLGNKYNLVGDSDSIFRVPNLMNYDVNNSSTLPYYIRSWNGHDSSKVGTTQTAQVGSHNHSLSGNVGTESAHVHDKGSMRIQGECGSSSLSDDEPFTNCDSAYSNGALKLTNKSSKGGAPTSTGSGYNRIKLDTDYDGWTGVTSGPKTEVGGILEEGHTHSLSGISTNNNTTDSTNENRVSSMLMVPIIKW